MPRKNVPLAPRGALPTHGLRSLKRTFARVAAIGDQVDRRSRLTRALKESVAEYLDHVGPDASAAELRLARHAGALACWCDLLLLNLTMREQTGQKAGQVGASVLHRSPSGDVVLNPTWQAYTAAVGRLELLSNRLGLAKRLPPAKDLQSIIREIEHQAKDPQP